MKSVAPGTLILSVSMLNGTTTLENLAVSYKVKHITIYTMTQKFQTYVYLPKRKEDIHS